MKYQPGHPPGIIGVVSGDMTRYADFSMMLLRMHLPEGSRFSWGKGVSLATNLNNIVRDFLKRPAYQWLWIMGDDHTYARSLLIDLLDRDVDVVAPLCSYRLPPYAPHVYRFTPPGSAQPFQMTGWADIAPSGLMKVDACGSAGLLVRRRVWETMTDPWFEVGRTAPDALGEDLWLCKKIVEAGFQVHVDCDHLLGHMSTITVVPNPGSGVKLELGNTFWVDFDITARPEEIPADGASTESEAETPNVD